MHLVLITSTDALPSMSLDDVDCVCMLKVESLPPPSLAPISVRSEGEEGKPSFFELEGTILALSN